MLVLDPKREMLLARVTTTVEPSAAALVDEIASAIRQNVATGRYPMGSRLYQEELASKFAVSRTPVREALRQLQAEGLIVVIPRRGAIVRGPSPREILEAYRVRAEIEGLAAELAATWILDDELRTLSETRSLFNDVLDKVSKATHGNEPYDVTEVASAWVEANDLFHELIQAAARNVILRRTIVFLHQSIPRGLTGQALLANGHLLKSNVDEHSGIYEALANRDGKRARELMCDHVIRSGEIAASWFELEST